MKELELLIKDLLIGAPPIKIVVEEEMEGFGEIVDAFREISYGQIEVSDEGKLTSLIFDIEAILENNDVSFDEYEDLSNEDLKEMAQDFVDEFGRKGLVLTDFDEWGNDTFLMTFEALDVKLNLPLPDSGVTLEMNRQGFILSATLNQSYYQLKYPEIKVTAEQALEIYTNRTLVEMSVVQREDEIRIMYMPKPLNDAVTVNGELISINQFLYEQKLETHKITSVSTEYTEQQLLGITPDLDVIEENQIATFSVSEQPEQKLVVDQSSTSELFISSTLPFKEEQEFTVAQLKERAIAFLNMKLGNVENKFLIEDVMEDELLENLDEPEEELTEEDLAMLKELFDQAEADEEADEEEVEEGFEFEPFISFSFHRYLHGIQFREYDATIDMGIYSGTVKEAMIPLFNAEEVNSEIEGIQLSTEEANELYIRSLQMKLARIPHEEDDIISYELCYVVTEAETFKRIEAIDAHESKIDYLDDISHEEVEDE